MTIPSPKTNADAAYHQLDCEFVLEPYFQEVAAKAEAAGWDAGVVARALKGLAEARVEMLAANALTDDQISRERAKRSQ